MPSAFLVFRMIFCYNNSMLSALKPPLFQLLIQCRLVSENRLPCPSLSDWFIQAGGQAGTTLSLTVTLSVVEGCLHPTFIENLSKLNDIDS
jgi:hypothetical protein